MIVALSVTVNELPPGRMVWPRSEELTLIVSGPGSRALDLPLLEPPSLDSRYTAAMPIKPALREAPQFPHTSLVALAAIAVSVRWWFGYSLGGCFPASGSILTEPWTLVGSILPHVNLVHLVFNLSWWWYFGTRLERAWGSVRLLGVVVLLAVISSAAEYAMWEGGVGLSGVVYGLCTLLWVAQGKYPALEGTVSRQTLELLGAWFVICIVLTVTKVMPVGNFAHGAGALAGWLLGKCIVAEPRRRARFYAALASLILLVGAGTTIARPWINFSPWMSSKSMRGAIALKEGRYEDAVRLLEDAAKDAPGDKIVLFNLGIAYQKMDRHHDALQAYKQAIDIDPSLRPSLAPSIASIFDHEAADAAKRNDAAAVKLLAEESLRWDPSDEYAQQMLEWAAATEGKN